MRPCFMGGNFSFQKNDGNDCIEELLVSLELGVCDTLRLRAPTVPCLLVNRMYMH